MEVLIGLGANLGDRYATFRRAILKMQERIGAVSGVSRMYETPPMVLPGKSAEGVPAYLNAAVKLSSGREPERILEDLLRIEEELGRDRSKERERWISRAIDLDLLGVGDLQHDTTFLQLPHAEMHKRDFVLRPLSELAPEWVHPLSKKTVIEMLSALPFHSLSNFEQPQSERESRQPNRTKSTPI